MDLYTFVHGPLLWFSFLNLVLGISVRLFFFVVSIIKSKKQSNFQSIYIAKSFLRSFLPYHRAFFKYPFFATNRYIFHVLLFVVPIWYYGHIILWEESIFEWSWKPVPSIFIDYATLIVICFCLYFLARRMASSELRRQTGTNEIALIVITLLPFVSGYMYSHGTLQSISFVSNNIDLIHTITGEIFIITAAFLFLKIDLDKEKCIGCSACAFVCPTHTLQSNDISDFRYFSYSHSQCISCGTCILYCPESATALHHEISLNRMMKPMPREQIFDVKLAQCHSCGVFFAPEKQMAKLRELEIVDQVLSLCPRCRAVRANASFLHLKGLRESRRSRRSA